MNNSVVQPNVRSKASWIEEIEKSLAVGDYNQAKSIVQEALAQFQDDQDLVALEEDAIQRRESRVLAYQLMTEGQELCKDKNYEEGLQVLRNAYALDKRDSTIHSELVNHLLDHSLATIESDPSAANSSMCEAVALDPENLSAESLNQWISAKTRQKQPKSETKTEKLLQPNATAPVAPSPSVVPQQPVEPTVEVNSRTSEKLSSAFVPKTQGSSPSFPKPSEPQFSKPIEKGELAVSREVQFQDGKILPEAPGKIVEQVGKESIAHKAKSQTAADPKQEVLPSATEVPREAPETKVGKSSSGPDHPATAKLQTASCSSVAQRPNTTTEPSIEEPEAKAEKMPIASAAKSQTAPRTPPAMQPPPNVHIPHVTSSSGAKDGELAQRAPITGNAPAKSTASTVIPAEPSSGPPQTCIENASLPAQRGEIPVQVKTPQQATTSPESFSRPGRKRNRQAWGWMIGVVGVVGICVIIFATRKRGTHPPVVAMPVEIHVQPPIEVTLLPVTPGIRLATDLEAGVVLLDDQRIGVLEDGQFVIDSVKNGKHTIKITGGPSMDALIPFEMTPSGPPMLTDSISAKNVLVVVVSSYQTRGLIYSNMGPLSLVMDGQPAGTIPLAGGLDLANLNATPHQLVLGDRKEQRRVSVDVNPAGGLFISVTSNRNIGTLEIVSNEDGFDALVDGKLRKLTKQKGHYYIFNVEANSSVIRIAKNGFKSEPPEQRVAVRKGESLRVPFKLIPIPTTASLHLMGALPGTRVSIDGTLYEIQSDGSLSATVREGEHTIEVKRQGYKAKLLRIPVKAGQTVNLSGNDVTVNDLLTGKLLITTRNPGNARVLLRRVDGTDVAIPEREAEEPEGDYTLIATAPGYREESRSVRISDGAPTSIEVKLIPLPPQIIHMEGWEDPGGWKLQNGWYTRKGGNFVLFKAYSGGTFQFTVRHESRHLPIFHSGRIQWVANYLDPKNYDLYQLDKEKLYWKRFIDGKPGREKREAHAINIKDETYRLKLEVNTGDIVQRVYDGQTWKGLPRLAEASTTSIDGRFGVFLPGNDELWIDDFSFTPE